MAVEPFKEDFLQRIKEVHWNTTKYWVQVDAIGLRPTATASLSLPDDAVIIAERTYNFSDEGGIINPIYVIWLPRTPVHHFPSSGGAFGWNAYLHEQPIQVTERERLDRVNAATEDQVIGYDTIEDALGIDNPTAPHFSIPSEPNPTNRFPLLDNPWPPVDQTVIYPSTFIYFEDEQAEASAKLAEIQAKQAFAMTVPPFPGSSFTTRPNQIYWAPATYVLEEYIAPPPDPSDTGFTHYSVVFEVSLPDGETPKTFSLALAGGNDPDDGSGTWVVDVTLFTKKSSIPNGEGGFLDHEITDDGENVFVANQGDDPDDMFHADPTNGGGRFQDGTFTFALGKLPWRASDPAGVGSKNATGQPQPGKIGEVWCTSHSYNIVDFRTKATEDAQFVSIGGFSRPAGPPGFLVP